MEGNLKKLWKKSQFINICLRIERGTLMKNKHMSRMASVLLDYLIEQKKTQSILVAN